MTEHAAAAHRPTIRGNRWMASSTHYLATQAAAHIFAAGGNAVDAGVASCLALAVVQPHQSNVGGVAPMLIRSPDGAVVSIAGLGCWPRSATLDEVRARWGGDLPAGISRTVVPAALSAYLAALERFGRLPFETVVAPARELAAGGFPMYPALRAFLCAEKAVFSEWPTSNRVFQPHGEVPKVGERFRQTELDHLFELLCEAERGASRGGRDAGLRAIHRRFYQGDIAEIIAGFIQSQGGLLEVDDMARFAAPVEAPIRANYLGEYEVLACGPWCQGPMLLQALKLVESYGAMPFDPLVAESAHVRLEAVKLALADREAYFGDPAFVDVPIEGLVSAAYADERRAQINPMQAAPGLPPPGNPWPYAGRPDRSAPTTSAPVGGASRGRDTTYACTVDDTGLWCSATPSDPSTFSPLVPGLGIMASPRGSQSWLDPSHPSVLAPGKRPRLTPNPALVLRDGEPFMAFGTPGGDVQCQAMLQVLGLVAAGYDPQAAVEAPRVISYSAPDSFWPHEAQPGVVYAESRFGAAAMADLRRRGHDVREWPAWTAVAGGVCAVLSDGRGQFLGAADPRRESYAIGW